MKTILVDDEILSMEEFEHVCSGLSDIHVVGKFNNAMDAWEYAKLNKVDFALLDVEMPQMNGLELGIKLKQINHDMILMYITGHTKYVADTLRIKADYCIMKPYDKHDVEDAVRRAKLLAGKPQKRMQITMFGRFQVFVDGRNVSFRNAKARELLALCVDHRGGSVSMEEAVDKLWGERPYDDRVKRLYRKAVSSLQSTLEEYGVKDIYVSMRGTSYVIKDYLECDYYDYLENPGGKSSLPYENYLLDYSWGEETCAELSRRYAWNCEKNF